MPRYFFNIHGENSASPDLIGRKLPDDEAARAEARAVAGEVAKIELTGGLLPDNPWIEVVDDNQRPLVIIPVSDTAADPNRTK